MNAMAHQMRIREGTFTGRYGMLNVCVRNMNNSLASSWVHLPRSSTPIHAFICKAYRNCRTSWVRIKWPLRSLLTNSRNNKSKRCLASSFSGILCANRGSNAYSSYPISFSCMKKEKEGDDYLPIIQ